MENSNSGAGTASIKTTEKLRDFSTGAGKRLTGIMQHAASPASTLEFFSSAFFFARRQCSERWASSELTDSEKNSWLQYVRQIAPPTFKQRNAMINSDANFVCVRLNNMLWILLKSRRSGCDYHHIVSLLSTMIFQNTRNCYTLKRKSTTSPSCMIYSLPSRRARPFSLAAFRLPQATRSS